VVLGKLVADVTEALTSLRFLSGVTLLVTFGRSISVAAGRITVQLSFGFTKGFPGVFERFFPIFLSGSGTIMRVWQGHRLLAFCSLDRLHKAYSVPHGDLETMTGRINIVPIHAANL